ncbi:carbon-monoxide dehydrogenase small subunit [Hoeflea marina]|uniref:Carbon-monoxide dehydrogenase small subunit n=1 Tax=Hoeflea marina TaxID=274592 RepID=A0A317PS59_9HYPH|nr:(2Fe-2S)-binding protein [Hoeflea marina]PWW03787.1 carbon-monoxide dehydrogenase small subunit [Hoeflea marina]
MKISFVLNDRPTTVEVEPSMLLSEVIRETLSMTGTHVGCDTSQCGACVVHVNGKSVKSCTLLAPAVEGADIRTVEGLSGDTGPLHPMQQAFRDNHGLQCGFCTPGMLMAALDLVSHNPDPAESDIREWLEGNICRCTGYQNIVKSVIAGAAAMRQAS